jgi:hypothetical protein
MDQPEVRPAEERNGRKTADANYEKVNRQTRLCNVGCVVPLCCAIETAGLSSYAPVHLDKL